MTFRFPANPDFNRCIQENPASHGGRVFSFYRYSDKPGPDPPDGVYLSNRASSIVKKGRTMTISTRFLGALLCLLVSLAGCSSEPTAITHTINRTPAPNPQYHGPVVSSQEMRGLFGAKTTSTKATPQSVEAVSLPLPYNRVSLVENLSHPMKPAGSSSRLQLVAAFSTTGELYYEFKPASESKSSTPAVGSVVATDQP